MDDEERTCPICFEPISELPEDAVVGEGSHKKEHKIAATVPCGHLFHRTCIHKWLYNGSTSTRKCPTCNLKFDSYVELFVDPSIFRGIGVDDDLSLSSVEENLDDDDDDEVNNNDDDEKQEMMVENENDPVNGNHQAEDDKVEDIREKHNSQDDPCGSKVVDLCESSDDQSVLEQASQAVSLPVERNGSRIISVTCRHSAVGETRKKRSRQASSNSRREDDDEIQRLTKIAKYYKKRYLQREQVYNQQQEQISDMSKRLVEKDNKLKRLMDEEDAYASTLANAKSQLDRCRYKLLTATRDRDILREKNYQLQKENDSITSHLKTLKQCHEKDLEDARGRSMHEIRQMTRKIRELEESQPPPRTPLPSRIAVDDTKSKLTKASTALVREFSQQTHSNQNGAGGGPRRPMESQQKFDSARYSSNAARMMVASSQQKERKASQEARAAAREMVLPKQPFSKVSSKSSFKTSLSVPHAKRPRTDYSAFIRSRNGRQL